MATVQESIDVDVPVTKAYNQWTQFEDFPHFMSGVDAVRQLDDTTVHFETSIAGVKREYDAQITVQEPDQRVSWESLNEPRNAGTVWFESLGPEQTKVNVELTWEPDSAVEKAGAATGLDSRQVASDLKKFKKYIESGTPKPARGVKVSATATSKTQPGQRTVRPGGAGCRVAGCRRWRWSGGRLLRPETGTRRDGTGYAAGPEWTRSPAAPTNPVTATTPQPPKGRWMRILTWRSTPPTATRKQVSPGSNPAEVTPGGTKPRTGNSRFPARPSRPASPGRTNKEAPRHSSGGAFLIC